MKSGEKLCPSIEKFVNCGRDIDQEAGSSNHIDPHFHILWFNKKKKPNITPEKVIFNALFQQSEQIKLANQLSALILSTFGKNFLILF